MTDFTVPCSSVVMRTALVLALTACGSSGGPERAPSAPSTFEPVVAPVIDAVPAAVVDVAVAATPDAPTAPATPPRASRIELAFVGDLMFGGYFDDHYDPQFVEKHDPLVDVAHLLRADLTFGNFETTITRKLPNNGGPHDGKGNKRFVTIPERAAVLTRDKRFHAVTLANNHQLDNNKLGLTETPKILDELGLKYVGAARTSGDKFRVETLDVKGWRVGFIPVTTQTNRAPYKDGPHIAYVPAPALRNQITPVIEAARANHDLLIVQIHWGAEYQDAPLRYQIDAAHAFVDAGADAVIAHHPHVLQGIERYKGGVIAYSLGNFVFPNAKERIRESGVLHLGFKHGSRACLDEIAFDPTVQIRRPITHPIPAKGAHRTSIGKRLSKLSSAFATTWDVTGERFTAPAACAK